MYRAIEKMNYSYGKYEWSSQIFLMKKDKRMSVHTDRKWTKTNLHDFGIHIKALSERQRNDQVVMTEEHNCLWLWRSISEAAL